jgi:hypothetical protein
MLGGSCKGLKGCIKSIVYSVNKYRIPEPRERGFPQTLKQRVASPCVLALEYHFRKPAEEEERNKVRKLKLERVSVVNYVDSTRRADKATGMNLPK